jgi:hypothetical protein
VFCPNCGSENPDGTTFCGACGKPMVAGVAKDDEGVGAFGVVLLCLPIVGAIMYFVWKDKHPKKSQTACYLALGGLALGVFLQVLLTMAGA